MSDTTSDAPKCHHGFSSGCARCAAEKITRARPDFGFPVSANDLVRCTKCHGSGDSDPSIPKASDNDCGRCLGFGFGHTLSGDKKAFR